MSTPTTLVTPAALTAEEAAIYLRRLQIGEFVA